MHDMTTVEQGAMDVLKTPKQKLLWRRSPLVIGIAVLVAAIAFGSSLISRPGSDYKLRRSDLLIGSVKKGDLEVAVDGYGILRSDKQALITALTNATVKEVLLRPGAKVEKDSVILQLTNPDVQREVELAAIEVAQEEADLRRLLLSNRRDLLTEQAELAELRSNHEILELRTTAQKEAASSGVIPKLDYQTTLRQQALMLERVQLQQQRLARLEEVAKEASTIKQEEINRAKARHQSALDKLDKLTVRAGLKGTLQRMPADLGQSVTAGQELALVGSDEDLLALVRVSQSRAHKLQVGQRAEINTRREKAAGTVTRIAPEVRDGTVEVEIKFTDGVPKSARPELNVDARVFTATLRNVLYIERPANVQANSRVSLFLLQDEEQNAIRRELAVGEESGRFIQVLRGAQVGDSFILSDLSNARDAQEIAIVN